MQSDPKQIYKITAARTGKAENTYRDIGNFIFMELNSCISSPKSLIIKLKGVGSWYMRKKRMEEFITENGVEEKVEEDFRIDASYQKYLRIHAIAMIVKERLEDYKEYLEQKKETRKKRNETSVLLRPSDGENEGTEPSKV